MLSGMLRGGKARHKTPPRRKESMIRCSVSRSNGIFGVQVERIRRVFRRHHVFKKKKPSISGVSTSLVSQENAVSVSPFLLLPPIGMPGL